MQKLVDIKVVEVWWNTVKLSHRRSSSGARFKGKLAWSEGATLVNKLWNIFIVHLYGGEK